MSELINNLKGSKEYIHITVSYFGTITRNIEKIKLKPKKKNQIYKKKFYILNHTVPFKKIMLQ